MNITIRRAQPPRPVAPPQPRTPPAHCRETATDQSARTGAWRALHRLQARKLIECSRSGTMITVTLLREDGSGKLYDRYQRTTITRPRKPGKTATTAGR